MAMSGRIATVCFRFLERQGIELVFTEKHRARAGHELWRQDRSAGRVSRKREEFSTLVHELAHEMLHKARTSHGQPPKWSPETEARGHRVCRWQGKVGLETGSASADYIHLYHGNASLLAESLEVIQQTSALILAALEPPLSEVASEQPDELAVAS